MRIWDIAPYRLCKDHLLGEHRELHAIWSILTRNKNGYSKHPETLRWKGKLHSLYLRHDSLVHEMEKRGYKHHTPLEVSLAIGSKKQDKFVNSINDQIANLRKKGCKCKV
ncbi:MAG TPA: pyrimidine dimer DNA glycosylase/endonuclease V [Nitrosopumilaceae archaeon]|nr:pyrimidine dimer DNA glycosylase/endonuclease V [Nitrosopumilaceae archaeon]